MLCAICLRKLTQQRNIVFDCCKTVVCKTCFIRLATLCPVCDRSKLNKVMFTCIRCRTELTPLQRVHDYATWEDFCSLCARGSKALHKQVSNTVIRSAACIYFGYFNIYVVLYYWLKLVSLLAIIYSQRNNRNSRRACMQEITQNLLRHGMLKPISSIILKYTDWKHPVAIIFTKSKFKRLFLEHQMLPVHLLKATNDGVRFRMYLHARDTTSRKDVIVFNIQLLYAIEPSQI